jgi:hypothetical protein
MAGTTSPAELIRTVLSNPASEQAIQNEMLVLAEQNLHQPDVLDMLVEVFPVVRDTGIRHRLQEILTTVDTSRYSNLDAFHNALITVFRQEKEHKARVLLLGRLSLALHQDTRLAPFFIEVLTDPALNDQELAATTGALTSLPSVTEDIAVTVLARAQSAPVFVQVMALSIAENCPRWGESLARALVPYLNVKIDPGLRRRILSRLVKSRSGTTEYIPLLKSILRTDTDRTMREMALELLGSLSGRDTRILPQILWTSRYDADPALRARAVAIQRETPDLPDDQMQELARMLTTDDAIGVRLQLLDLLKPGLSKPSVRSTVLSSYKDQPAVFEYEEFGALVDMLAPYVSRDQGVRDTLLQSWTQLHQVQHRKKLADSLLPKLKPDDSASWAVTLFSRERNAEIRQSLFERLKGLSVAKNPDLARVFCAEIRDPGSAFRLACARALAGAPDAHPDILPAFEDVLQNDQERELVRTCLDGYLKPGVTRRFEVLLAVIGNEALDITSRQICLDQCVRDGLSPGQTRQMADVVAASKTGFLRMPA